jgi:ubiquinone biosynthesis monooxygenase Coq7
MRQLSPFDNLLIQLDKGLRTVFAAAPQAQRENPAQDIDSATLSDTEKQKAARLMRINHAGEVSAQALYQGQALGAHDPDIKAKMQQSAEEENNHLKWCEQRIHELDGQTSLLNPLWYTGSFVIGASAAYLGDKWSLGFVVETENQVVKHLNKHLQQLPVNDQKTRAILQQMKTDEKHHATVALKAGAEPLPAPIKFLMRQMSQAMTKTTYWL